MAVRLLNCCTCNARVPAHWHTGALCMLIETQHGLVLVDTRKHKIAEVNFCGCCRRPEN